MIATQDTVTTLAETLRGADLATFCSIVRNDLGASDVLLDHECPPAIIVKGRLIRLPVPHTAEHLIQQARIAYGDYRQNSGDQGFEAFMDADAAMTLEDGGMVRIHLYQTDQGDAVALRIQPKTIWPFDTTGAPPIVLELAQQPQGLLIFSGPVRHGKTTLMHSIIEELNQRGPARHVMLIADPPEYHHVWKNAIIHTRAIGVNAKDYATAIRGALRVPHHVLGIGEVRGDTETTEAVIQAAILGSTVLTTVHVSTTVQAINRFIGVFEGARQQQIRETFAAALLGVVNMRLVPTVDGNEVAACEVLVANSATRELLHDPVQLRGKLDTRSHEGMQSLEADLVRLLKQGRITKDTAVRYAVDASRLDSLLRS